MRAMGILRHSTRDDRRTLLRTAVASAVIMVAGTVVLMAPFLSSVGSRPDSVELALYSIPQALPLSIPIGLTFGILWGLGRFAASPRSQTLILVLATIASVASFSMLAWIVPTANQAFRVSMIRHSLQKGVNELTLGELRPLLEPGTHEPTSVAGPSDRRSLALNYHARWALSGAPLVLSLFAVALTSRRRWGRMMPFVIGGAMVLAYYVMMYSASGLGLNQTISPFAAAWMPNTAFLMLWLAIMRLGSRRTNGMARA
jgi:lipopolysaccharide export LptBFGC system permease protein LptF